MHTTIKVAATRTAKITTARTAVTHEQPADAHGASRVLVRVIDDSETSTGAVVATLAMDPDVARDLARRILAALEVK